MRWSSGGRGPRRCPTDAEIDRFATAVTDAGVQLVGLNFFAGDMAGGDRGLVSWPARSAEFRDNVDVTVGIGERLGCRAFNALYGNRTDDSTAEEQDALAAENLALAARAVQRIGGTVLVEPVSGAARYPLLTAADALAAIDRAGEENIALLLDVYHLAVNGDDVDAAITAASRPTRTAAAGRIGHVQIADAPGRNEPGTGKLDIDHVSDSASPPPATTAGSGSSTSPPLRARTPSTGCPASAGRPADPLRRRCTTSEERCIPHDDYRLYRPRDHGWPDGREPRQGRLRGDRLQPHPRTGSQALVDAGGRGAGSVAEVVAGRDVVITMVPDSPDVEAVTGGDDGVFASARSGALYVDMSTIRPDVTVRVAEAGRKAGLRVLDAPVSGGEAGAIEASLSIMVGGEPADFEAAKPVLDAVGKTVVHVGPAGSGQTVKAANQLIVAGNIELLAEAVVFLEAYGVDMKAALEVLGGGLAGSTVLNRKGANMLAREFTPGFRLALHHKDLGIVQSAAREAGVVIPLGALVSQLVAAMVARGDGGLDHSGLLKLVLEMSGRPAPH